MNAPRSATRAFSLVEIMVAIAVLAVLGILIAQITDAVTRVTRGSNRMVDAAGQARLVFDCLRADLEGLVRHPDADFIATNTPSSARPEVLFMLSAVTSSGSPTGGNRGLSVVSYRVGTHPDNSNLPCLVRAAKAVGWQDWGIIGLKSPSRLPVRLGESGFFPASLVPTPTDYDVLAPGVIRMVVGFQLYPDDKPVTLLDGASTTLSHAAGQIVYVPPRRTETVPGLADYIDVSRISALIIGLVAMDGRTLQLPVATDSALSELAADFAEPSSGQTPVQAWRGKSMRLDAMPASVPSILRQSVRVFERAYPIQPYGLGSRP